MCFLYSQTPVTAFLSLTKFDIAKRSGKENMCFWCWNERRRKKPLQVHFLDLVVFIFEKWGVKSILPSFLSLQHLISFVKTKKKELWSCRKLNHFFFHKSLKQRRCLYSHRKEQSLASKILQVQDWNTCNWHDRKISSTWKTFTIELFFF